MCTNQFQIISNNFYFDRQSIEENGRVFATFSDKIQTKIVWHKFKQ